MLGLFMEMAVGFRGVFWEEALWGNKILSVRRATFAKVPNGVNKLFRLSTGKLLIYF